VEYPTVPSAEVLRVNSFHFVRVIRCFDGCLPPCTFVNITLCLSWLPWWKIRAYVTKQTIKMTNFGFFHIFIIDSMIYLLLKEWVTHLLCSLRSRGIMWQLISWWLTVHTLRSEVSVSRDFFFRFPFNRRELHR
jgi:hypothetical protein